MSETVTVFIIWHLPPKKCKMWAVKWNIVGSNTTRVDPWDSTIVFLIIALNLSLLQRDLASCSFTVSNFGWKSLLNDFLPLHKLYTVYCKISKYLKDYKLSNRLFQTKISNKYLMHVQIYITLCLLKSYSYWHSYCFYCANRLFWSGTTLFSLILNIWASYRFAYLVEEWHLRLNS